MADQQSMHEHWSSRLTFLLAAIGFAVGLGNIWRFPYLAGENGGSAFVIVYLIVIFCIGAPLVAAELMIGRRGGMSPVPSMRKVALESGASGRWGIVGVIALVATFLILTFYTVVAGWAADYLFRALIGSFRGITAEQSSAMFEDLLATPWRLALWQVVIVVATVYISSRGITRGIERASLILMPMLFAILLLLAIYGMTTGAGFREAARFMLEPDFSKVGPDTVLAAIGQAFFSVGVAMGGMMTYGAYMPKDIHVVRSSLIIVSADTTVALVAGFAIFPIVFASGLSPAEGTGLVFLTLPIAFGSMPFGALLAVLFFLLLVSAALTSTIANLEPLVSWAEEQKGASRKAAAIVAGVLILIVGSGSVLSFNLLADFRPLGFLEIFRDMTIYDVTDYIASNVLLPVGGMLTAIFAGWFVTRDAAREELGLRHDLVFHAWRFLIRFIAPIAIGMMLVAVLR
jgi:neurotransmitter:Na+ symporter, NSS family